MKKKLLTLVGAAMLALTIGACGSKSNASDNPGGDTTQVVTKYTVAFNVDGARWKTMKFEEGSHITGVGTPTKEGYIFDGWLEGTTLVDLETYVVTKNTTFDAKFSLDEGDVLSVDDVKEEGKTYYLVMGWWECTDKNEDGSDKITSTLTRPTVRLFYENLIKYLKAVGATDANIENIQFRNYSSGPVADMGAMVNADADVDILIGVGNNINSSAGVALHNSSNDYKFATPMGTEPKSRYVACTSYATELGVATYEWLKGTDAGKAAFVRNLTDAEIQESLLPETIDLTVRVHGDTVATTTLDDKDDVIQMPEITVAEDKQFKGFATTENAEEAQLNVAKNATLKYDDVKDLVAEGANTLDLYPVIKDAPVVVEDLVVYIQTGSKLSEPEAALLEARFKETLTDKNVRFETNSGDAAGFTTFIEGKGDADVIVGGNNPLKNYTLKDADNYPLENAGAKHFADTSRKVVIPATVATGHLSLAQSLYNFVKADAPEFEVHAGFWTKSDHSWVTETEVTTITAAMQAQLNTYLGIGEGETLLAKYNVVFTIIEVESENNTVAKYGEATRALRDGKGTDLIIGCGDNVDSATGAGMTIVAKKKVVTTIMAAGRRVALVHENPLARNIYDTYFTEDVA